MKTTVNSDTWIRLGSRTPMTASDGAFEYMIAVSPAAPINSTTPCAAVVVALSSAQTTNALHSMKPYHDPLSTNAAATATTANAAAMLRWGRKYLRSCSQEIS